MHGELIFTMTPDHVRLHGFYTESQQPLRNSPRSGNCDAAILLHGLGGNFYSSRLLLHFASVLQSLGMTTVVVNTRGHDMINTSTWAGRARSVGAALESVGDAVQDIAGWSNFLKERGYSNVLLFGHSLGAIKSLFAQAHQPHPNVKAIVGLSATRLSYEKLIDSPRGDLFRETIERCRKLIAAGDGEVPIHVPFPFPTWMTPTCYLEKYGPEETYNWIRFIDRVEVPSLLLFGARELEHNPAFEGLVDELEASKGNWRNVEIQVIPDADHFYVSQFDELEDTVSRWLI